MYNNVTNNMLISKHKNHNTLINKSIELFVDFSYLIKDKITTKYLVEYQVCGADIIFDSDFNPYLLELNYGFYPALHHNL